MRAIALTIGALLLLACGHRPGPERPITLPPAPHPWLSPQLVVGFRNQMGASFRLAKARFVVDGRVVLERTCADEDAACREQLGAGIVYSGSAQPGPVELEVSLDLRGHGEGVFSYLSGYSFAARSRHTATSLAGRRTEVVIVGFEQGGPTAPLEERPAIRWQESFRDL